MRGDEELSSATLEAQALERERLERLAALREPSPTLSIASDDVVVLSGDEEDEALPEDADPSLGSHLSSASVSCLGQGVRRRRIAASGAFSDDRANVPDAEGRLLVNPGRPAADPDILVPDHLATKLKPHQVRHQTRPAFGHWA